MPYARLEQAIRLAAESAVAAEKEEWRRSAFVGWQVASTMGASLGGGKPPTFERWLKQFKLHDRPTITKEQREAELAEARANVERVREAFKRGGVRLMN